MNDTNLDITLGVRVSHKESAELKGIAKVLRVPYSQIAREAILEKVDELKRTNPKLQSREISQVEY